MNFLAALTAVFGAIAALTLGFLMRSSAPFLIPFAVGALIYIAGSDLIPELRKEEHAPAKSALELAALVLGVLILLSLVFLE